MLTKITEDEDQIETSKQKNPPMINLKEIDDLMPYDEKREQS